MKYVIKPVPVEAMLLTNTTEAMTSFLGPGEFTAVGTDSIYVVTPSGTFRAWVNQHYLVRDETGVHVADRESFEEMYMPLDSVASGEFTVTREFTGESVVTCGQCGERLTAVSGERALDVAREHVTQKHGGS